MTQFAKDPCFLLGVYLAFEPDLTAKYLAVAEICGIPYFIDELSLSLFDFGVTRYALRSLKMRVEFF